MIKTKLMPHQRMIVDFMNKNSFSAVFADYGTGKTLCALQYVQDNVANFRKILVVSSKTAILSTWPSEIRKHTDFTYIHLLGNAKKKYQALRLGLRESKISAGLYHSGRTKPVIFLINFDGIRNVYDYIAQANFDLIIIDESTKIKSPAALRTKVLWSLGREVEHKVIMTGFPVTENVGEVYSQVKFLDQGKTFGNSYYGFLNKYFTTRGFKRFPKPNAVKSIFKLLKPFCIRVTNDVIKLPPKVYEEKIIQPTAQQAKLLSDLQEYFRVEFGKVKIDTQYIFALINKSLQICDGFIQDDKGNVEIIGTAKDEAIIDLLEEINPIKNKVVVWCVFRFSVSKLTKLFRKLGYNAISLTGSTEDVDGVVRKFQFSKDVNILVTTQKKASESITLTNCKYAIYYSNNWSYDLRANSEARIRRKGSEKHSSIIYTDLILDNSVEQLVYDCLRRKKNLVESLKDNFRTITASGKKEIANVNK